MALSKIGELIVKYEEGNLNGEEIINLFQLIYDTKAYTWLQGCYGRTLQDLINADLIKLKRVKQWLLQKLKETNLNYLFKN